MMKCFKALGKRLAAVLAGVAVVCSLQQTTAFAVTANGAIAQGVDVSKHNGAVNWGQVAASGMKFAFIKAGSTKSGIDPNFAANITGAQAAGLKTGVYLYSYATTPEAAANEANLLLQWINGYTVNYPVVFDIEDQCQKNLGSQQLIDIINAFCTVIDAAGYYPVVYSNKNMFVSKLGICGWDKWVAQYNSSCDYNNNVCFWQYSSHGSVSGFGSRVDVNYQYKDYSSLIIQEGFLAHNDTTRFYRNWRMQKGWIAYNDTKYYLDGAGNLVHGWFTDESGTYYLSPADGSIARGQCTIDGGDYYFTAEGVKLTGWVVLGEQKFYYDPANNGIMKREWFSDEKGNFYFFDRTDGHMLTGAQTIDKQEYLFSAEGIRQTGLIAREDGSSYYYDPATGQMLHGFIQAGDKTYYGDEAGHIVTGVYTIGKQSYYFDAAGVLVKNQELLLDGVNYVASAEGVLTEVAAETAPAEEIKK
jgi:glucan-binding repeat-containing protein